MQVENEEKAFKKCDRNALKVILKLCRSSSESQIKNLKVSDIDIKFSRDLSDNLLVKTQALINLGTANIPPQIANAVIGLFSDPVAVTKMQQAYIEEKRGIEQELSRRNIEANNDNQNNDNNTNKINEQNNNITETNENQNQEQ